MDKTEMQVVAKAAAILRKQKHAQVYAPIASEMEQLLIEELLNDDLGDTPKMESKPKRRRRRAKEPKGHTKRTQLSEADFMGIAQAYNESEPGGRTAAISEAIGCSPKSVGYYVKRAREMGYVT